jgi:hypothetical protein
MPESCVLSRVSLAMEEERLVGGGSGAADSLPFMETDVLPDGEACRSLEFANQSSSNNPHCSCPSLMDRSACCSKKH